MAADREAIRCTNAECPSAKGGGRVLMERGQGGLYFVGHNLRPGERFELSFFGPWVAVLCPSCRRPRINPDLAAAGGIAAEIERALTRVAERAAQDRDERGAA